MPRKMRRLALRSALSVKAGDDQVVLLDDLKMEIPRTAEMVAMLGNLGIDSTALLLLPEANPEVERAARNLPGVKVVRASCLNVRDILQYDYLIMPLASLEVIDGILG
jgi:large subunit ribosomal protein L4